MIKQLLTYCFLCLSIAAYSQQQLLKASIEIKDAQSGKAITAGLATSFPSGKFYEIAKGKLELRYQQKMLKDSLFIDVQGYAKHKISFTDLLKQRKLLLAATQLPVALQVSNLNKSEQLNEYDNNAVLHWVGLPVNDQPFRYLQVGQVFENARDGATLSKIKLNQLLFDMEFITFIYADGSIEADLTNMARTEKLSFTYEFYPSSFIFQPTIDKGKDFMRSYTPADLQSNKFKLRIYHVNDKNQPLAELYTDPILVDRSQPVHNMHISLSKYKILLPKGKFMIAVEWMPIRQNIAYTTWTKARHDMTQNHKPFIGVSEKTGDKLNVMALDYAGNWKPFDYLSPYYTDLAMQCEIEY